MVFKDERGLSLCDESGKVRAGLAVDKNGPILTLHGETGKPNAGMRVRKDGPETRLFGPDGKEPWKAP